jgi:hypothetical protein
METQDGDELLNLDTFLNINLRLHMEELFYAVSYFTLFIVDITTISKQTKSIQLTLRT